MVQRFAVNVKYKVPNWYFSSISGRVSPIYWGFIATCQVVCLHMVQSSSSKTEIFQKTREKNVAWGRTKM